MTNTTSAVASFIATENAYRSSNGIAPMTAGQNVVDFSDVVAAGGSKAFTAGADAVIMDGARTDYAVQVDSNGKIAIKDINSADATYGQTITVTGASYLVFNGSNLASSTVTAYGAPTYPGDIYFVEGGSNATLAGFYAAIVQRSPDLGGLEFWENTLASRSVTIGATSAMSSIASDFLNIMHTSYSTSSPITTLGGDPLAMTNTQYVDELYQNFLGRGPDSGGLAYWVNSLDTGTSKADVLVLFTQASALLSAVNAEPGSTAGTGTGWLINYGVTGGYADPGVQQSVATVLTSAASTGYLDTSLIDPSTITATTTIVGSFSAGRIGPAGLVTVGTSGQNETIVLSNAIVTGTAAGANDTIIGPSGGGGSMSFTANNGMAILHGNANTVNFQNMSTPITGGNVIGWNSTDTVALQISTVNASNGINSSVYTSILTPTSTISGASLNFLPAGSNSNYASYVVNLGNVGGGTIAEVVAKANALYTPTGAFGESIIFMGTTNTGDTVLDFWGTWGSNGLSGQAGRNANTGDINGNHSVDAREITASVTLIGVQASSLTIANFHHF